MGDYTQLCKTETSNRASLKIQRDGQRLLGYAVLQNTFKVLLGYG